MFSTFNTQLVFSMALTNKKVTLYIKRMQLKVLGSQQRSRRNNLSRPDRRIASVLAQLKTGQIWDDIKAEWKQQDNITTGLATKHNKTYKCMLKA
jgi:hypothetical protein